MSLLLSGLSILLIGDSHLAYGNHTEYLITTLHEELMQQGAVVNTYSVCGAKASDLMNGMKDPFCGFAFRLNDGKIRTRGRDLGPTIPLPELVGKFQPNLIVVVNSDTMASYKEPTLNKAWVASEVSTLTHGLKASGVSCMWVGPTWGTEGGKYNKTFARAKELSDFLAEIVSPCTYVDSLKMSQPGEWSTLDGMHLSTSGYQNWGSAITRQILTSATLPKIKAQN